MAGTDNAAGEYIPGGDGRHRLQAGQNPALAGFSGEWTHSIAQYELGATPVSSLSYSDGTDSVATSGNAAFRKYTAGESTRALDNSALGLGVNGNTRYFSFLMQLGDATAYGDIDFGKAAFENTGRLRIRADGNNFVAHANFVSTTLASTDTAAHLFVWKITYGTGSEAWSLFMDPTNLADEGSNTALASGFAGLGAFDATHMNLSRGTSGGTGGNGVMFDEVRVGETWADATTIPEPATLGLMISFGAAIIGIRRLMR